MSPSITILSITMNELILRLCGEVVRVQPPQPVRLSSEADSTISNSVAVGKVLNLSILIEKGNANGTHLVMNA